MHILSYGLLALLGTVTDLQGTVPSTVKSPCFAQAEYSASAEWGSKHRLAEVFSNGTHTPDGATSGRTETIPAVRRYNALCEQPRGAQLPAPGAAVRQPPLGYAARIGEQRDGKRETLRESESSQSCWAEERREGVRRVQPHSHYPVRRWGHELLPAGKENEISSSFGCINAASYRRCVLPSRMWNSCINLVLLLCVTTRR